MKKRGEAHSNVPTRSNTRQSSSQETTPGPNRIGNGGSPVGLVVVVLVGLLWKNDARSDSSQEAQVIGCRFPSLTVTEKSQRQRCLDGSGAY